MARYAGMLPAFFVGMVLGAALYGYAWPLLGGERPEDKTHLEPGVAERSGQYDFINPLLDCAPSQPSALLYARHIRGDVQRYIDGRKSAGLLRSASVYFRDLNMGPWFGINEREEFTPASMMKVPMLMTYMKAAEYDQGILQQRIKFTGRKESFDMHVKPVEPLVPGQSYTVKDLLYHMIVDSDNDATYLLHQNDTGNRFGLLMGDMGFHLGTSNKYTLRVKDYAAFFRVMYNASYLDRDASNLSLAILTLPNFRDGLPAGVPQGVDVAHKFGEFSSDGLEQFHDCGIVYMPQNPYILCVMTRGEKFAPLVETVAGISNIVYAGVEQSLSVKGATASGQ